MRFPLFIVVAALSALSPALAETPNLPADAVQLKGQEIGAYLDGKRFSTVIYDAEVLIEATVNWDLKKGIVFGDFKMNGEKGKFENEWVIKGNTSCGEKTAEGKWVCQKVYVGDGVMYEINKKGKLHAVSKEK
jgi:hypothetical protein